MQATPQLLHEPLNAYMTLWNLNKQNWFSCEMKATLLRSFGRAKEMKYTNPPRMASILMLQGT